MAIINLPKYYYPTYKKDTFIEVSDEIAKAKKAFRYVLLSFDFFLFLPYRIVL